jgi:SAM-dependent methyltransferase
MTDRAAAADRVREHYERVWQSGDAWELESSPFEAARYDCQLALLDGRRYPRALEIGCGSGVFTRRLAGVADRVLAIDVAEAAVGRARAAVAGAGAVEVRAADVMQLDLRDGGPWDLVVFSETIYCLAWAYPFFDVAYLAARLRDAAAPGGRLMLANTYGAGANDWLLRPWLIDTYRDLFRNVGYQLRTEDVFRGTKHDVELAVLMSLFEVPDILRTGTTTDRGENDPLSPHLHNPIEGLAFGGGEPDDAVHGLPRSAVACATTPLAQVALLRKINPARARPTAGNLFRPGRTRTRRR